MNGKLEDYFKLTAGGNPVDWGVNRFPDGQIQFWFEEKGAGLPSLICSLPTSEHVDLFLQMVDTLVFSTIRINYLYGARSDKHLAGSRTVCNVPSLFHVAFIQFIECKSPVQVLTPHCDISRWIGFNDCGPYMPDSKYDLIVYPDESAQRRVGMQIATRSIFCQKERDQVSGLIIKHVVPSIGEAKRILVADDLCDGGRTFLDIAKEIDAQGVTMDLAIVHGIFSNGAIEKLLNFYNVIHVTNSFDPTGETYYGFGDRVKVTDVWA